MNDKINPRTILLIKSHSLGIGDALRSSAAWRALHDKWPGVQLHFLFLSKHEGYPTEELLRDHHLLRGAHFVTVRKGDPSQPHAKRIPLRKVRSAVETIARHVQPDLVIDCEPSGLRTTIVTRWAARASDAKTLGIAQFPGRGFFYDFSSPSVANYIVRTGVSVPMDYTERDFVVLSGVGIHRQGRPIELEVTQSGALFAQKLRHLLPVGKRVVVLNIGCGTEDAKPKRPPIGELAQAIDEVSRRVACVLVLAGAPFEKGVNQAFVSLYRARFGSALDILDVSGQTSLSGSTGLISLADVFISSDSGPYHMAVAMRKPTLCWFTKEEPASYHRHAWCCCLIKPTPDDAARAILGLLSSQDSLNAIMN